MLAGGKYVRISSFYIILLVMLFALLCPKEAKCEAITSDKIFSEIIEKKVDTIIQILKFNKINRAFVKIADANVSDYIINRLVQRADSVDFIRASEKGQNANLLNLFAELGIDYSLINNNSVQRTVSVNINGFLEMENSELIPIKLSQEVRADTIDYDKLNIEYSASPFPKGTLPKKPKSFFEEYIEPIVFISSALITIIVLFTIRSN